MHVDSKGKKHMKGKNKETKGRKRLNETKKIKRSSQVEEKGKDKCVYDYVANIFN